MFLDLVFSVVQYWFTIASQMKIEAVPLVSYCIMLIASEQKALYISIH